MSTNTLSTVENKISLKNGNLYLFEEIAAICILTGK